MCVCISQCRHPLILLKMMALSTLVDAHKLDAVFIYIQSHKVSRLGHTIPNHFTVLQIESIKSYSECKQQQQQQHIVISMLVSPFSCAFTSAYGLYLYLYLIPALTMFLLFSVGFSFSLLLCSFDAPFMLNR